MLLDNHVVDTEMDDSQDWRVTIDSYTLLRDRRGRRGERVALNIKDL